MGASDWEALGQRKRVQMLRLQEVSDLTRQLAQAVDRHDEASVALLLDMREEPVRRLAEMENSLQEAVKSLPEDDAVRARELLAGGPARTEQEIPFSRLVGQYRRLLESVLAVDQRISLRMGGRQSIYSGKK